MPTGRELIKYAREQLLRDRLVGASFDQDEFNLWQNMELLQYIDQAAKEACLRSRLLVDSTNTDICSLAVTADDPLLTIDSRVHEIERIKLASQNKPLIKKSPDWLDVNIHDWEAKTGEPKYYTWDGQMSVVRLVGIPEADDTATLRVWRAPLRAILLDTSPEIDEKHHYHLLHWVCHLAYLKTNSNTFDQKKSDHHGSIFSGFFGDRPSGEVLEQRRRHYKMHSPANFF